MNASKHSDIQILKRLFSKAQPYWSHILGIFLIDLLATPLALLNPLPLKIAVDNVLGRKALPSFLAHVIPGYDQSTQATLLFTVGLLITVALMTQLQSLGSSLLRTYTGEKLVLEFRGQLFRHAQHLPLAFHDKRGTSDSTYRIQYDTHAIQYVAIDGIIPFVTAVITLLAMLYVIFRINWQLALVALIVSPFLFFITRIYRRDLREQSRQVKRLESTALSVIQEVLTALRVVKAFGQEEQEYDRFMRKSNQGVTARIRYTLTSNGLGLLLGVITTIGTATVLYIGIRNVQTGALTLGSLLLVMGYLSQLYSPLTTISRKVASLQNHLASAERAFDLLDERTDVIEKKEALPILRANGAISFKNVSFGYKQNNPILHNISFDIPAGARVGIAGETGAGKTTLVNLLTRLYDPSSGAIYLDSVDLREYKLEDLRNQFAIVLQEPILFSTTIEDNIGYAKPGASKKKVIQAAEAANAHEFISVLPEGYQTQVGERGMSLSGGERQRIALARAFLKDAPILIMDEPTSSVDMKTEAKIISAMKQLMKNRTTLMIAHRLSTLENCNQRIEINKGQIINLEVNQN